MYLSRTLTGERFGITTLAPDCMPFSLPRDEKHYGRLHPVEMSLANRKQCLWDLKEIGYQVGCGFMVGSPFQTAATLARDLKFIEEFSPDMCGIGPFIPQKDTPFGDLPSGTAELTVYLLSLVSRRRAAPPPRGGLDLRR